jgi:hypothetical protein
MNILGYIMMIKFKLLQVKKVLNIPEVSSYQVIHRNYLETFLYETVTQMRP